MNLKTDDKIKEALEINYTGLTEERKEQTLATIRATRPEKLDELHAIFILPPPQGLGEAERSFYDAIVDLSGEEEALEVGADDDTLALLAATNGTPPPSTAPAVTGRPARKPFVPGATSKSPATNGTIE